MAEELPPQELKGVTIKSTELRGQNPVQPTKGSGGQILLESYGISGDDVRMNAPKGGVLVKAGGTAQEGTVTLRSEKSRVNLFSGTSTSVMARDHICLAGGKGVQLHPREDAQQEDGIRYVVEAGGQSGIVKTAYAKTLPGRSATFTVVNPFVTPSSIVLAQINNYTGKYGSDGIPYITVDDVRDKNFDVVVTNIGEARLDGHISIAYTILG